MVIATTVYYFLTMFSFLSTSVLSHFLEVSFQVIFSHLNWIQSYELRMYIFVFSAFDIVPSTYSSPLFLKQCPIGLTEMVTKRNP